MLAKDKTILRIALAEDTMKRMESGLPVMDSAVKDLRYLQNIAHGLKSQRGLPGWWPNKEKW